MPDHYIINGVTVEPTEVSQEDSAAGCTLTLDGVVYRQVRWLTTETTDEGTVHHCEAEREPVTGTTQRLEGKQ